MARHKRVFRSPAEIEEILARQEESGLSVSAFAKLEGVPSSTIHNWRKVRSRKSKGRAQQIRLRRVAVAGDDGPRIEFEVPSGIRVRVPAGLPESQLGEVLRAALSCSA